MIRRNPLWELLRGVTAESAGETKQSSAEQTHNGESKHDDNIHKECRNCGLNLSATPVECPRCGGEPAVYEW